ncbi:PepSY domain-containing protein [Salinisphaera sp. Q1T1-3]|uniref:PepSY domain-containing protein n=1 Tax=Salinisphaera sp. Q1T1-3 TaxID=2321229 RepID=UPI000E75F853|nr:PepSY domain-containing protein [Salinisphaera sp. Q1T1-3]RJS95144.1 hypothetical protein D3260_00900 [Salinisphaera sp. Q1T1-3]
MTVKKRLQRITTPVHRYLGIGLALVMLAWFVSGIVMVFVGYPTYDTEARRADHQDLDPSVIDVTAAQAARVAGLPKPPTAMRIDRADGRTRIRVRHGDGAWYGMDPVNEKPLCCLDARAARQRARQASGAAPVAATLLHRPDQWTFASRLAADRPLWRVRVADGHASDLYFAARTGELVHSTTARARAWGWAGPVIHWVYFTELRRAAGLWRWGVISLAVIGLVLCLSGLLLGVLNWRARRRRRPGQGASPYRGLHRWHHYTGLTFGAFILTWLLSGIFSLDPLFWADQPLFDDGPSTWIAQRHAPDPTIPSPASLATSITWPAHIRQIRLQAIGGVTGYRVTDANGRSYWIAPGRTAAVTQLGTERVRSLLARRQGHPLVDLTRLTHYDAYYQPSRTDRLDGHRPPLPVYRARYDDGVLLYFDPARARVVTALDAGRRVWRWLYTGLHDFDLPPLQPGSLVWYGLILSALAGGTIVCLISIGIAMSGLRRHRRRSRRRRTI